MPRFFLPAERLTADPVTITGDDARHISLSLRMAAGDSLTLCDMRGTEYDCVISAIDPKNVYVKILTAAPSKNEPPYFATLYQCVAKGEKMDTVVQKAVECGVSRIVPVESERCIAKIPPDAAAKKLARWQKIADEAAGQCGRAILPGIERPVRFADAIAGMASADLAFLCYEGGDTTPLGSLLPKKPVGTVAFLVGPEGGISPNEAEMAKSSGIALCGLGNRILRTESAAAFVLAGLSFRYELSSF